ncbi:MAG: DNA cytosine methyltransferase [Sediminibacterium sp.]|nr:DNA cytosine methyltransferase [Sediminibacterium sp.]MDP3128799.1 DNA cytosine methyltransferase [Sediminibacterium sp.]
MAVAENENQVVNIIRMILNKTITKRSGHDHQNRWSASQDRVVNMNQIIHKKAKHGVRPFTVREFARLQGFPDDFVFEEQMSSYRIIGNAVPVQMGMWAARQAIKYFN